MTEHSAWKVPERLKKREQLGERLSDSVALPDVEPATRGQPGLHGRRATKKCGNDSKWFLPSANFRPGASSPKQQRSHTEKVDFVLAERR